MSDLFDIEKVSKDDLAEAWAAILIGGFKRDNPLMMLDIAMGGQKLWIERCRTVDTQGFTTKQLSVVYRRICKAARTRMRP